MFDDIKSELNNLSSDDIIMIFGVLIGIMIVSLIILFAVKAGQSAKDNSQPVRKEMASVVEKDNLPPGTFATEIYMLFETENGERLRLRARAQNSLVVGDKGYLTWQGSKVVNFERV